MKRFLAGVVVLTALFAVASPSRTLATSIVPVYQAGNVTDAACVGLGYAHGASSGNNTTFVLGGGVFTWSTADGTYVDWNSTVPVDAVFVKGGNNANRFDYSPSATGDTGLYAPNNPNGKPAGISHVVVCYHYNLQVEKTADTTYSRDWDWSISKEADQTDLSLAEGQQYTVNYEVAVDAESTDSEWAVSGTITITNPDPTIAASVLSVADSLSGFGAVEVDCPGDSIAALDQMVCTYGADLPDGADRTNTATVTTLGLVGGGSGSADVAFGDPTTETDECITVSDTNLNGPQGVQVCAGDAPETFNYSVSFGKDADADVELECDLNEYLNEVSFTTGDTQTFGEAEWTVNATVECSLGCTLTQGYWKTHNASFKGGAPEDDGWQNIPGAEGASFYSSAKSWFQLFWTAPSGGNVYIQLAHQYMAAKLNVLNGAAPTPAVSSAISYAESFFPGKTPATSLSNSVKNAAKAAASTLGQFNEGRIGPGHCSEQQ